MNMILKNSKTGLGAEVHANSAGRVDDVDRRLIKDLLQEQGWVLFKGFNAEVEQIEQFTTSFGRCAKPRLVPPCPGGAALGFHAEDAYNPWRPDVLWFLCVATGSDGGTPTGVVDGVALLDRLPLKWQDFSLRNQIMFDRVWPSSKWKGFGAGVGEEEIALVLDRLPGFSYLFEHDGSLRFRFQSPLVVETQNKRLSFSNALLQALKEPEYYGCMLENGSAVPEEYVLTVEEMAIAEETLIPWENGDFAVIDNYRLMHRRNAYHGTGRDLRVVHGEEFFGGQMPLVSAGFEQRLKEALQGEEDLRDAS